MLSTKTLWLQLGFIFLLNSCASTKIAHTDKLDVTKKFVIAVVDFSNNSPNKNWAYLESVIPNIISSQMAEKSNFKIVERQQLNSVMAELKLSQTGIFDKSGMQELGKLTGANAIITGNVTQLASTLVISARIIKVETGEVVGGATVNGESEKELHAMLERLTGKIQVQLIQK
ncbi:CsgG/HfaB family protein [bacterium]|nr:hypothetical protein [Candidatus Omnitrophota bacterium]MBU2529008.1 CsgG/HfaB family protein [bacterium]MBU3929835.1 CsgG/HfaB family protein [bacterium]MBU4122744.1 CsgG/HfaB family protein [bacterium]